MALKAGRVGVAPDQVDDFGQIKSEATSGYTKQEADAKFETKTNAAAALAEKQSILLGVPIELLSGSALTVEDALYGINDEAIGFDEYTDTTTDIVYQKVGRVVTVNFGNCKNITAEVDASFATVPERFRPSPLGADASFLESYNGYRIVITRTGNIFSKTALSNSVIRGLVTYLTNR